MCEPISAGWLYGAMLAGTAVSAAQAESSRKSQSQAATKARTDADTAFNKANPKKPALGALSDANTMAGSGGVGRTLLTSPGGISAGNLTLGRTTLLGGVGG